MVRYNSYLTLLMDAEEFRITRATHVPCVVERTQDASVAPVATIRLKALFDEWRIEENPY